MVIFRNRMSFQPKADVRYPVIDPEAYHNAKLVAPGYDVYWLEQEWRIWRSPERHLSASARDTTSSIRNLDESDLGSHSTR
jgi:hypothetical protein